MAAPSGTVWGSIAGGYGRIGIYVGLSNSNTQTTVSIETWFWTKWSCVDANNSYYYDNNATSATTKIGSIRINHQIASGTEWSTSNQTKLGSSSYTYDRGASSKTISCAAKLIDVDKIGAAMTVSTSYTIPAKPSYTITYNANGGSGAPSSQTKWYGTSITLSSVKPTRTGYTFLGWATSSSGGVVYAPGASYTSNAAATLYAVWKAYTYTVKFDANGGSGAPGNQTKTYNVTLTLSTTKPTRTNYNFLGWATSPSSTTVLYASGASYTNNAAVTLYAVWELAYIEPIIYNLTASRCDSTGILNDSGTYARVKFDWGTTYSNVGITVAWESASASSGVKETVTIGTSGTYDAVVGGSLIADSTYKITVTVRDYAGSNIAGSNEASTTLNGAIFPIDCMPGGRAIGFGKPAELAGVADFGLAAKFNGPVFGNVLGLNRLPEIGPNSDFNDYMTTGSWAVYTNANAETISNIPVNRAGRLEVSSSTGEGIRSEQYSYLRQRFIPYNSANAVWERDVSRGSDNVWRYYDWWRSTLTPEASERAYKAPNIIWGGVAYMIDTHTANLGEKVSEQNNGIILVFSQYSNGDAADSWWNSFFVPKHVVANHAGTGHCFIMAGKASTSLDTFGMKYLYIHDDKIVGHATNTAASTGSGITYANAKFVLRYVIGV